MANFQKHGKNVHGTVIPAPMGGTFDLGLWGPIDTRTSTELDVSIQPANAAVKIQRANMLAGQNVRVWKLTGLPAGRTLVEARDTGGATWTSVTIECGASGGGAGKKYTADPNEVITTRTTPTAFQVVNALLASWSSLTVNGARTLTAQFMAETGAGKHCYNWNLGNVKAGPSQPHMYLRGVWEIDSEAGALAQVDRAGGLAHIATDEEIKKNGWGLPTGKSIAVFNPPHPQCRFRAFTSLGEGARQWLTHHQAIAGLNPTFLASINSGNVAAVAKALKQAHYYTQGEALYARAMTRAKAEVDRSLGPLP